MCASAALVVTLVATTLERTPYAGGEDAARRPAPPATAAPTAGDSQTRGGGDDGLAASTSRLLARLERRLSTGTAQQAAALAAPGDEQAAVWLRSLHRNVDVLDITGLSMRYLRSVRAARSAPRAGSGDRRSWTAEVALGWRLDGVDDHGSAMTVRLVLRADRRGDGFVSAGPGAAPLWLLHRVAAVRTPRTLVIAAEPVRPRPWSDLARQAVRDVGRVLPGWRGRLVVEVPAGRRQLARVVGAPVDAYVGTAAVATTTPGRGAAGPVHVFVNRPVIGRLGARGSQIVLSHEATHVATRAPFSRAPAWLVEGFADYVALRGADLPVRVAAAGALGDVRADGPPSHLPGAADFAASEERRGDSYEGAWLACRLLARTYGEDRLVAFYRASDRGSPTDRAFRTVLRTDEQTFTRAWRRELRRLAG